MPAPRPSPLPSPVEPERITSLRPGPARKGAYVLYWMQKAQRARQNPALEEAAALSAGARLPLVVLFVLADFPGAAPSHYRWMLAGLAETGRELRERGMAFVLRRGQPREIVADLARDAAFLVLDSGRVRAELAWRGEVLAGLSMQEASLPVCEVETEAVVPPRLASLKDEWSAATFRRKVEGAIPHYLRLLPEIEPGPGAGRLSLGGLDPLDIPDLFQASQPKTGGKAPGKARRLPEQVHLPPPGRTAGLGAFESFLAKGLPRYAEEGNDPGKDLGSGLSPYLHFGQVSPIELALAAQEAVGLAAGDFLEQLIVRRELAANFALHNPRYDAYDALPPWALEALERATPDPRPWVYRPRDLEAASTHDPYWNAAQDELVLTGTIHNYLRMYWGKKILEWSASPAEAFRTALWLNDAYALDGRDPNGYAGVAWCFGKHDRPWAGRPIYGTVRCMMASGLERKFDMGPYLSRIAALRTGPKPTLPRA